VQKQVETRQPGTVENTVLIGHDGYLFLAGGGHDVMDYVTGNRPVAPVNFEVFARNITARAAWAKAQGAAYKHVIMPDKQSVQTQAWTLGTPVRMGALYMETLPQLAGQVMYPAAMLAEAGARVSTRTDTHLTTYGSLLVTAALVESLTGESQDELRDALIARITKEGPVGGDLGGKLTPPVHETTLRLDAGPPGTWLTNAIPGGNNGGVDLRFNPHAKYRKCVAFFGDSFGRDLCVLLQFWFSEVYFFRTGHFHPEIAAGCGPDIVITENVERYMHACLDDEEQPQFLLYPFIGDKPYAPEPAFAGALSAVLSFPRAPYARFVAGEGLTPRGGVALADAPVVAQPVPAPLQVPSHVLGEVLALDGAALTDAPHDHAQVLEAPRGAPRLAPALVLDPSGRGLAPPADERIHIHGSFLTRRTDALLFGTNHLVDAQGHWSCEVRNFKSQFVAYHEAPFYEAAFPGPKPHFRHTPGGLRLSTADCAAQVEEVTAPVFLATPLEPASWGRWLVTVLPKAMQFQRYGAGRKFLCHVAQPWQRSFLELLGVPAAAVLPHDPARAYLCRDVMTVEYSQANMTISTAERSNLFELVATRAARGTFPHKIVVSRLARKQAHHNALVNEAELVQALEQRGFTMVDPELLPLAAQIGLFAAAEQVVFVGGAVCSAVFSPPGASVITIEPSGVAVGAHTSLFASLGLRYGVIFGQEDEAAPAGPHGRWRLDLPAALAGMESFFAGA